MIEVPLYQGAMPRRQQQPQLVKLEDIGLRARQEQTGRMMQAVDVAEETFNQIKDYGTAKAADKMRSDATERYDRGMKEASELPPGHAGSLWDEQGRLRQERLAELRQGYEEELAKINPRFMDTGRSFATYRDLEAAKEQAITRSEGYAHAMELSMARKSWGENFELKVEQGRYGDAVNLLKEGVMNGVVSEAKAELMKLKLGKHALARRGGVAVGGREYSGLGAELAAQAVRDGYAMPEAQDGGEREKLPATDEPEDGGLGGGQLSLKGVEPEAHGEYTLGGMNESWLLRGDYSDVLKSMNQQEFDSLSDSWVDDVSIKQVASPDGGSMFVAGAAAPEAVQRMAAQATERGVASEDSARAMVASIAMDAVMNNGDATAEQIVKMFEKSGVYETLGGGDSEVGKVRAMATAEEMVKRGKGNSLFLGNDAIKKTVNAAVESDEFGAGSEWKEMERLNPGLKKGEEYKHPKGAGKAEERWFALFEVYKKYRDRFNPQHAEGVAKGREFEQKAQEFYDWHAKNIASRLKKEHQEAARDWYLAAVMEGLRNNVGTDKEGKASYGGYASDVAVMRDVLKQSPPLNLGVEERLNMQDRAERDAEARSAKFRQNTEAYYAKLLRMKQGEKERSEQVQNAKKREEEKREKEESRREAARLHVARKTPRVSVWGWDGKEGADGEMPACTIPEAEYKRLVEELGYDGTQDVYVQVQGGRIQVVGANKKGRIELNTAAVSKVQKRPNRKKGEKWKLQGNLGYSYDFKTIIAK